MATILVLNVKVPFTMGGQDVLVHTLIKELRSSGHTADIIELPYSPVPKEGLLNQIGMWRALDLSSFGGKKVDLVIATKFPSYFVRHPKKSLWLVHQHRPAYELYGGRYSDISDDPRDEQLRRLLYDGDTTVLSECSYRSAISRNVADRLQAYNNLTAEVLYPPLPLGGRYRSEESEPYILYVGRLCHIKRIELVLKGLSKVHPGIKFKIVGSPDEPEIMNYFRSEISLHNIESRVEFLGRVDDETLLSLFARALGVYFAPYDEDFGYITLEAMASGRPLITAHDSGGTLEFIRHEENGLIVDPDPSAMAGAINRLVDDRSFAQRLGQAGRDWIAKSNFLSHGWNTVVDKLLSPLEMS